MSCLGHAQINPSYVKAAPNPLVCFATDIIEDIGVGCELQSGRRAPFPSTDTLVTDIALDGLLAGPDNADRAAIAGLCNFIQDIGGTIGITGMLWLCSRCQFCILMSYLCCLLF